MCLVQILEGRRAHLILQVGHLVHTPLSLEKPTFEEDFFCLGERPGGCSIRALPGGSVPRPGRTVRTVKHLVLPCVGMQLSIIVPSLLTGPTSSGSSLTLPEPHPSRGSWTRGSLFSLLLGPRREFSNFSLSPSLDEWPPHLSPCYCFLSFYLCVHVFHSAHMCVLLPSQKQGKRVIYISPSRFTL